jgi:hypothetical protein
MLVERLKKIGRAITGDHAPATSPQSKTIPDAAHQSSIPALKAAKRATTRRPNSSAQKFRLNFRSVSEADLSAMAVETLHDGGYAEPEPQPPREPDVGDTMPDGTVFAGISPDSGKAMFATPADAPLTCTFDKAQEYAADLNAHGHQDWRVPTKDELNVLFNNRAAIGGFKVAGSFPADWHWSSSTNDKGDAWGQRFSSGCQYYGDKDLLLSLRCVR